MMQFRRRKKLICLHKNALFLANKNPYELKQLEIMYLEWKVLLTKLALHLCTLLDIYFKLFQARTSYKLRAGRNKVIQQ